MRHIPLKNAFNVRDMGGYPTTDGKSTKWGMLYRSDALSSLTEEDWQVLKARKIHTVIDLRSLSEISAAPVQVPEGTEYDHFSLMPEMDKWGMDLREMGTEKIIESMKLDYGKSLFRGVSCCARILETILKRSEVGSVLFMCSAGKDRTGIIAALILYLCDVVREDIIADYMVSSVYNTNGINRKIKAMPEEIRKLIPDPRLIDDCLDSKPETMMQLLCEMEAGDIRTALDKAGFSTACQKQLKEKMTGLAEENNHENILTNN